VRSAWLEFIGSTVVVRHIQLALEFAQIIRLVDQRFSLAKHEGYLYQKDSYPKVWVAKRINDLRKSKLELESLITHMRGVLGASLKPSDTEEFINSLIKWRLDEIEGLLRDLGSVVNAKRTR
jgi:hypothetical protein